MRQLEGYDYGAALCLLHVTHAYKFLGQRQDPHVRGAGYGTLDYAAEELRDLISVIIITVFRT